MSERNRLILIFSFGILLIIILFSFCIIKYKQKLNTLNKPGFILQEFQVINSDLDSITMQVRSRPYILSNDDEVMILILSDNDSIPNFYFTSEDSMNVSRYNIFGPTRRIVGYINSKTPILVLSTVQSQSDFECLFYSFIRPTNKKKKFAYINFPEDLYICDENGCPSPPPFYDPIYYVYAYKGGKFNNVK